MLSSAYSRRNACQVSVIAVAMLLSILLLSRGARGEVSARPQVDRDPGGAPYVAGELLVTYDPGTPERTELAAVSA